MFILRAGDAFNRTSRVVRQEDADACPSGGTAESKTTRSNLSRSDLIQLEGTVTKALGGGRKEIQCENDMVVSAILSGRMKKHRIKVMVGDRVQVSVSPYDPSHGIITYRFK